MSHMGESHNIKIKKFNGNEFGLLIEKVVNGRMFLDLDGFLSTKAEASKADEVIKDKKALAFEKDSLSYNLFRKYDQTSTKDLWPQLKAEYEKIDAQLLFVKRNKFLFCTKKLK